MKNSTSLLFSIFLAFIVLTGLNSCTSGKTLAYFNNIVRDSTAAISGERVETIISKSDILSINIGTPDDATNRILNSPVAVNEAAGQGGVSGYLVDERGFIKIPLIGDIHAAGLTKRQLIDAITEALLTKKLAKDPIVNIRLVNFRITVLGEVVRPGVYNAPNERMTLPEALGMAGDLSPYGRRYNVLLVREVEGKRIFKRFSLNKDQMFNKDIYNLQNQDLIYVEPNDAKAASGDRLSQLLPILFSTISLIIVIYVQFIR